MIKENVKYAQLVKTKRLRLTSARLYENFVISEWFNANFKTLIPDLKKSSNRNVWTRYQKRFEYKEAKYFYWSENLASKKVLFVFKATGRPSYLHFCEQLPWNIWAASWGGIWYPVKFSIIFGGTICWVENKVFVTRDTKNCDFQCMPHI